MPGSAAIIRLRQSLLRDIAAADALAHELRPATPRPSGEDDRVLLGYLAMTLQQLYNAVETAMARICRALEGTPPTGADSHRALLDDMTLELPGIRPAVLRISTADALRPVLRFRHFVRHASVLVFDHRRVDAVVAQATRAWAETRADLEAFAKFLEGVASA